MAVVNNENVPFYQSIHASKRFRLLTRKKDIAGNEYIYLQGVASLASGDWVSFDEAGVTTRLVANAIGRVGVAQSANTSTTNYSWFLIYGTGKANVLASYADNSNPYCTATAGSADDAVVSGDMIVGAFGRSAIANGQATMELTYPQVTNVLG